MPQGEDLGVSLVAGREQPSHPADDQVTDSRDEVHRRQKVTAHRPAQSGRKHLATDFRHLHADAACASADAAPQHHRRSQHDRQPRLLKLEAAQRASDHSPSREATRHDRHRSTTVMAKSTRGRSERTIWTCPCTCSFTALSSALRSGNRCPKRPTRRAGCARSWSWRVGGASTSLWLRSGGCARE